jgi:O-antigen/teichoic acid export membrane protein
VTGRASGLVHLGPDAVVAPGAHVDAGDLLDTPAAGPAAIRGSALRGAGYVLGLLLSVGSVPFVIRHLGIEDFGHFVLVNAIVTLASGLTDGGVQAVGVREYASRSPSQRQALMRDLLGLRIVLTAIGMAAALAFTMLAGYDRTLVLGTALVGFASLLTSIQSLLTVPLASDLRLGWISALDLGRILVTVVLMLALVVTGAALLSFFAVVIVAAAGSLAASVVLVRRSVPLRPTLDPARCWALLRDTIPYAAAIALNVAYFRIAIVIMSLLTGALETGYFATSFRILEVLLPVPALIVGSVFPILARAARDDPDRLRYATQRIFEVSLIAGVGLVLVLELAAPTIIAILADDAGARSVDVLRVQAPAIAATFVAIACGYPLLSLRRHRALLLANVVPLVASVVLCFALIPLWGAIGGAVATTVAELGLAIAYLLLLTRYGEGVRLSVGILGPVALAAALGFATLALPSPDLLRTAIGAALYLAALAGLGRIPPELLEAARGRRGRAPAVAGDGEEPA